MNYCVVAFGVVLIIAIVQWFVDSRKTFTGPDIDNAREIMNGQVAEGVNPDPYEEYQEKEGRPSPEGMNDISGK